jgi:uncharacterized membrane protein YgcG
MSSDRPPRKPTTKPASPSGQYRAMGVPLEEVEHVLAQLEAEIVALLVAEVPELDARRVAALAVDLREKMQTPLRVLAGICIVAEQRRAAAERGGSGGSGGGGSGGGPANGGG